MRAGSPARSASRTRSSPTSELDDPEFARNPSFRCYVCQGMRMDTMLELAARARLRRGLRRHQRVRPGPRPAGARGDRASAASTARCSRTASTRPPRASSLARSGSRPGIVPPTPVSRRAFRTASRDPRQAAHDRGGRGPPRTSAASRSCACATTADARASRSAADEVPRLLGLWPEIEPRDPRARLPAPRTSTRAATAPAAPTRGPPPPTA